MNEYGRGVVLGVPSTIPNDCSANVDFPTCFELLVSYDWRVNGIEMSPGSLREVSS